MGSGAVVTLVPSATDLVAALGAADRIVGVSHECDHRDVLDRPVLTRANLGDAPEPGRAAADPAALDAAVSLARGAGEPLYLTDADLLGRLAPEVVVAQDVCDVCAVTGDQVACDIPVGAELVRLTAEDLDGLRRDLRTLGAALGDDAARRAEAVVADVDAALAEVARSIAGRHRPRTLLLEWSDPPYVAGHWVPELLEIAGGVDVLGAPGAPSRRVRWSEVAAADPDVIVFLPCGYELDAAVAEGRALLAHPAAADLRAVVTGQVWALDATRLLSRCTPVVADAARVLAGILHPESMPAPTADDAVRLVAPEEVRHPRAVVDPAQVTAARSGLLAAARIPATVPPGDLCRMLFADDVLGRVVIDETGTVIYVNDAAATLAGLDTETGIGTNILDFVYPGDAHIALAAMAELGEPDVRTVGIPIVFRTLHPDGTLFPVAVGAHDYFDVDGRGFVSLRLTDHRATSSLHAYLRHLAEGATEDEITGTLARHVACTLGTPVALGYGWRDGRYEHWALDGPSAALAEALATTAGAAPWAEPDRRATHHVPLDALPDEVARAAAGDGHAACWIEPVLVVDEVQAVLLVWRPNLRPPLVGVRAAVDELLVTASLGFRHIRARRRLVEAASTDGLTGLANRRTFFEVLQGELDRSGAGVVFVDLDGFKAVNDRHGHGVGDLLLAEVAARLTAAVRDDDVVARLGGDEFAIVCVGHPPEAELALVADRVVTAVREPFAATDGAVTVGASVGVAVSDRHGDTADALVEAADRAQYRAKRAGGTAWAFPD